MQSPSPAHSDAPTGRRNPCATCGACCRSYLVPVCGHDVWRISTGLRLGPEQFLFACPQDTAGPDGFRLSDSDTPTYGLALDKQGPLRASQPCVFLVQLAGGHDRCGIYAERPIVCQGYPMTMWRDTVVQRPDALCPPDSWSADDLAMPAWRVTMQRLRMHFDVYHEVVSRWNTRVARRRPHGDLDLRDYFSYLLNVYDGLSAFENALGAERMTRVQEAWPTAGAAPTGSAGTPVIDRAVVEYLDRVGDVLASFD